MEGKTAHQDVSFDVNPTSRQLIQNLAASGQFTNMIAAGARFHQAGCMGCIGMGQAPATDRISLRTMPRKFPGRSGTVDDQVYLCSPETLAAAALTGKITDPRDLEKLFEITYPQYQPQEKEIINTQLLIRPLENGEEVELVKGPNIKALPEFEPIQDNYRLPVLLKMQDNISTDEILRAGAVVLPYRSNIPAISRWSFSVIDDTFHDRALEAREEFGGHIVVAGENYAQGSSREHAAIAPRYLGQVAVVAKSYARLGWQNLANFGVLPLEFTNPDDYDKIEQGDVVKLEGVAKALEQGTTLELRN